MMRFEDVLSRVYDDINLGLLDEQKDENRWGNLYIIKDKEVLSVTVPQYAKELCEHPGALTEYIRNSESAREYIKRLEKGLE